MMDKGMRCPVCKSTNTYVYIDKTYNKVPANNSRGCAYWLLGGWIISLIMWFTMFWFKLLIEILRSSETKTKIKEQKRMVCNSCGFSKKLYF